MEEIQCLRCRVLVWWDLKIRNFYNIGINCCVLSAARIFWWVRIKFKINIIISIAARPISGHRILINTESIKISSSAWKTMIPFLIKVCTNRHFSGILMEVKNKTESLVLIKNSIFCTFNSKNKQNQLKYSIVVEVNITCLQLMERHLMKKGVSISLCYCGKKTDAENRVSRQKVCCITVVTVDLPLAGNCGRKFLFALICLTLPSYHAAVPGAYSVEIGWILPLSENEIKLNFNCSWAVFIVGLQPLQIYSETSKSSANLWARYVFHSHLSLLWKTSSASIANISLDVGKNHHDPRKNDLCKAGRLIKGEQQVITKTVTNYKTSNYNN